MAARFLAASPASAGGQQVDRRTGAVGLSPVSGPLAVEYQWIDLPLRRVPSVEAMAAEAAGEDRWKAYHARLMLKLVEAGRPVPDRYTCPLAVWQFSDDLTLIGFSGEVVAGYVPLVEKAIGPLGLWVAAYCNVLYGYVPTVQVLEEGGYESCGLEDGEVGQFAPEAEAVLLSRTVHLVQLGARGRAAPANSDR